MAHLVGVFAPFEERLRDQRGERRLIRAFEHGDGLLAGQRCDHFGVRERLQQLDRHQANLVPLAAQYFAKVENVF